MARKEKEKAEEVNTCERCKLPADPAYFTNIAAQAGAICGACREVERKEELCKKS